jgi:hypothetical protein
MAKRHERSSYHATLYDFRDLDIMFKIAETTNHRGVASQALAELMGFEEEDGARPIGIRLAWMKRYGMVAYDDKEKLWKLTRGGERVTQAHLRAPELRVVETMPDEKMVEVMAHVTSRFQRGELMLAHMLRREFMFGTQKR